MISEAAGCAESLVCETGLDHNGALFSPDDPARLAALLEETHHVDREALGRASERIIARYTPEAFAQGLDAAIQSGRPRSGRGLGVRGRLVMGALGLAMRQSKSFHAVSE